jgi:hypothetical protein
MQAPIYSQPAGYAPSLVPGYAPAGVRPVAPEAGGVVYQPANWAAFAASGPLHLAGLASPTGVPSFEAFEARIQPGCCDAANLSAIEEISTIVEGDRTLTLDNRELARAMLVHFPMGGTPTTKNCFLGWGLLLLVGSIVGFIVGGAGIGVGCALVILCLIALVSWCALGLGVSTREGILKAKEAELLQRADTLRPF